MQSWQEKYKNLESECEVALQEAARDKDEAVKTMRDTMQQSMQTLKTQYEAMRQRISVLGTLYSNMTESFILLEKQAKQFPKMIRMTISDVTKQVGSFYYSLV